MASRVLWRRLVAAGALYGGTVFGVLGTLIAARVLGPASFGLFVIATAAAGFFQLLLDTTVEESVVKYGIRYAAAEQWGRLRRLFRAGLAVKWAGGALACVAVLILAQFADVIFDDQGLETPLLVASLIPLAQAPEGVAGASMIVAGRYDLRATFSALGMLLRLVGLVVGVEHGVTGAVVGVLVATALSSAASGVTGWLLVRRFPGGTDQPIGDDRRAIARFTVSSGLGTSLVSMRNTLAPLTLGVVSAPVQAGYFRAAQAPITGLEALSAPARLILLTEQTHDVERGEVARAYRTLRGYMLGAAALSVIVLPVFWLSMPWLMERVYGSDYVDATLAAQVLLIAACLRLVLGWSKTFPVSIGRPGLRIVAHGVEIAVLLPLVAVLGAEWGATGAAVGVLAGTVAFALAWVVLLLRLRHEPIVVSGTPEAGHP